MIVGCGCHSRDIVAIEDCCVILQIRNRACERFAEGNAVVLARVDAKIDMRVHKAAIQDQGAGA